MTAVTSTESARFDEPDGVRARGLVIVLPGRGEHPPVYERFARRLAADAYRVRVVGDATSDVDGVGEQVAAVSGESNNLEPTVLIGSDTGALAALRWVAEKKVRVDGLVLAGVLDGHSANRNPDSWQEELVERTSCPTHQAHVRDENVMTRGALRDEVIPPPLREAFDPSSIQIPVLGLHGAADTISPLKYARRLLAVLPSAQLISVRGGKHDVLNDAPHRSVAARIVLFLEALRNGAEITRTERLEGPHS
jgi:alpha-beta hydrolase superfamily lysophospholipase